jgi:hypothetical protein
MLVSCRASCFVPDLPRFDDHPIDNSNHDHLIDLDAATGGGRAESMNGRVTAPTAITAMLGPWLRSALRRRIAEFIHELDAIPSGMGAITCQSRRWMSHNTDHSTL